MKSCFLDPDTGEVLRTWDNPYTGETVDVIHVANDPVNGRPNFGYGRDGKVAQLPIEMVGDYWQMNLEIPLFYHNILGGNYQKYVGGSYHATELFNYYGMADSLLDDQLTSINPGISWVRIAQWLPWMEMGGRDGITYFNAQGTKLKSWDDLPDLLKSEIAANYPKYRHAPPGMIRDRMRRLGLSSRRGWIAEPAKRTVPRKSTKATERTPWLGIPCVKDGASSGSRRQFEVKSTIYER